MKWDEFELDGLPDDHLYCQTWVIDYLLVKSLVVGTSVIIALINILATFLFEKIVVFERQQTLNDETKGVFRKITFLQFINIALIIILVNFSWLTNTWLNFLPILNGTF